MQRQALCRCVPAALAALLAACGDGGSSGTPDGGTDTDTDTDTDTGTDAGADGGPDGGGDCTETAAGTFPGGATEIAYEEGGATDTVADYTWGEITGSHGTYVLGEEPMWEAVRFDIPAPATIYGARVQWGNLTGGGVRPVRLGAYADFGSNGFDFWQWDSLWEGDRCLAPADDGAWVDYVFDAPIEMDQPGLFYIAHFWGDPSEPLLKFDPAANDCTPYDGCHSSLNMPGADDEDYYNGLTFQFQYDYGVRLMVELHDTIPAEDKWFQPSDALAAGGRVAWGDYDNDGWDDLMTNGPTLYHNEGDGTFTDVTAAAGLTAVTAGSGGGVWGDYDNDGWLDYFGLGTGFTTWDILLHNDGDGTFTDVTGTSLISDLAVAGDPDCDGTVDPDYAPTEGAAWVDLDSDGLLDLYLAEYECGATYTNYIDRIFHNEGDGTFVEWGTDRGFSTSRHAGRGVSPADYDQDGAVDVFVSNYRLDPNFMFHNNGDGTVTDVGATSHLRGFGTMGAYGHTIGSAWIDVENDGDFDLLESNLAHPRYYGFSNRTLLMINDGAGVFTDIAADAGIIYRETHSNPTVQDFNNDGYQDFFITCVYDGRFSEMYFNNGDSTFDQVNYESGAVVYNGWGSAASDYDFDGDVDLVAYTLFDNVSAAAGNNWLQVRTLGGTSGAGLVNAAGIGAVVTVTVDGEPHLGHTSGGSGTGCQDTAYLVFGLGTADTVDSIDVLYPGGAVVTVSGPIAANQRVWIRADGTVTYGFDHPI
jgi:hypothetical protein